MLQDTAERWIETYRGVLGAQSDSDRKRALYKFVDSGMTYSGLLCEDYFLTMKYTQAHRGFYQKEINLVSGLTSSLMGLAEASAGSIAATGALFSFSNASFDAYNDAFVFSADLNSLESLVRAKQYQQEVIILRKLHAANEALPPDAILTLDQAVRELDGYTFTCTRGGITALLNETVLNKTANVKVATAAKSESNAAPVILESAPDDSTSEQLKSFVIDSKGE
ncbi:hypothetical protein O203_12150 [Ectopseudomonas chengduensis]|nr:hypothetical protein O203_12150 [Pseudomonas chengduensis]